MSRRGRFNGGRKAQRAAPPASRRTVFARAEGPGVRRSLFGYLLLAFAFSVFIEFTTLASLWVAWLLGVNATTLVAYSFDKQAAIRGHWRVPEAVLHALAALGGSPTAFLGRALLRHKTRDRRFGRVLLGIGSVHACLLLGLAAWMLA